MPSKSLNDAFRGHPVTLHSKHIDFRSLRELPESFKWNPADNDDLSSSSLGDTVPVINLFEEEAMDNIGEACKTWGVFQVINHGVSPSLLKKMEELCLRLFKLPIKRKVKAARQPDGVAGYGVARISSFFSKRMWSEGFTILGSPLDHFRQLWPHEFAKRWSEMIAEYEEQMRDLSAKLMLGMVNVLGITMDDIKWASSKVSRAALQLNYYPPCPEPDQAMGLAAHTDSTLLTILYQSNTAGLQVVREGTGWVTVPPIPGGLIVNVGDLFHILSNGIYRSALHQARVNQTRNRISVAYLFGPPPHVEISPLTQLVSPNRPALYRPITWNEYLGIKAKLFNKGLSSVLACPSINLSEPSEEGDNCGNT